MKKLLLFALIAALIFPFVGCSDDDDDDPPPDDPSFGPSTIAVGENGAGGTPIIFVTGDMLTWSAETTHGITADGLTKVVKVPTTNRLVVIVDIDSTTGHDTIYYNDNGGTGTWLAASFDDTGTEDRLDPEHRDVGATAGYNDWDLYDIYF